MRKLGYLFNADLISFLGLHPPPDAGGERVVAYGLVSSAASSDLLQPVMLIPASRLHRSKRRNACGAFLGHGPLVLQDPA